MNQIPAGSAQGTVNDFARDVPHIDDDFYAAIRKALGLRFHSGFTLGLAVARFAPAFVEAYWDEIQERPGAEEEERMGVNLFMTFAQNRWKGPMPK